MNPIPLYEMFPFVGETNRLATDYTGARVVSATINNAKTSMKLTVTLTAPAPPYEINLIEEMISKEFGIDSVTISASYIQTDGQTGDHGKRGNAKSAPAFSAPAFIAPESKFPPENRTEEPSPCPGAPPDKTKEPSPRPGPRPGLRPIMGRANKVKPIPMGEITIDHGRVTIKGEVNAVRNRYIEKRDAWFIDFDVTDYTGTINVIKYMREKKASSIANSIKKGMFLTVTGTPDLDKYNELVLGPINIVPFDKEPRHDAAEEKRVELHLHTKMSAMDALTDTAEAIKRAAMWGHPAIAITDHGVVHSFPAAAKAVKKLGGKIKIIYGVEGYLRNDDTAKGSEETASAVSSRKSQSKRRMRNNHIVLLVKNQTGLTNLYKLITKSHLEHYDRRPIIYKSVLEQHKDGLMIGSACEAGEVYRAIVDKCDEAELRKIAALYDYLEIMPVCNNDFMLHGENPKAKNEDELREFNRKIVQLGHDLNKPVVATGDVHFLDPEHEVYRHILQTSRGYSGATNDLPLYFKTTDEMLKEFSYLGQETAFDVVVKNPRTIADICRSVDPLPPEGQLFPPKLDGSADELRKLVSDKLTELYGENPPEIVESRKDYELNDILTLNYDVIYMAAQKLVAYLRQHKSRVGSRGSVGSSLVAYLAGITEVNPLPAHYRCPKCKNTEFPRTHAPGADMPDKTCTACGATYIKDGFNIPFETFMGFAGKKVPDIDLNISSDHQTQAHKYISDMFGADHVFRAGTIGTVKDGYAYRFAQKYLDAIGRTATKAEQNRLAQGCLGVKQTTGQHPGGLIVIPQGKEVTDFCPAQHPADDSDKGVVTLHFEYEYMDDNLIKLDILGHDNPTMLKILEDMTGINADDIKLDDPETMAIFSSPVPLGLPEDDKIIGKTGSIGIPEFGTPFTRQMLCDTEPRNFDTLVRLSGYSHGENVWLGNAKDLINSGKVRVAETISSRDDIMLYLESQGMDEKDAFKISESVRKGYGLPDGAEDKMLDLRVPPWYIESCKKIKYLFPKAHAVAYVMMAFRIAWFKVHKPLEFYSAHFYRRRKSFDVESMTRGIDIVRSKIRELQSNTDPRTGKEEGLLTTLESCYEFYKRGFDFTNIDLYDSDAEKFLITRDEITGERKLRPPFLAIAGLGETAAFDLVDKRNKRDFISVDDLSAACQSVNKTHIDQLKKLGALRGLPDSSQMSLF